GSTSCGVSYRRERDGKRVRGQRNNAIDQISLARVLIDRLYDLYGHPRTVPALGSQLQAIKCAPCPPRDQKPRHYTKEARYRGGECRRLLTPESLAESNRKA